MTFPPPNRTMRLIHAGVLIFIGLVFLPSTSHGLGIVAVTKKTCLKVQKTKVPIGLLKSYIRQTIPMEAILFVTIKNKELCADPTMDWVKKAIAELDKISLKQPMKRQATHTTSAMMKTAGGNRKRPTNRKQKKQQKKRVTPQTANKTIVTARTPSVLP
ncbi:C-C motif chemokine 12-like [Pseudophryne corroboree]|uniref:C-C motif chemokine 12-like n=1 Tax=Pseudophryne corroboree TaxID=495146 RepID=UPI003081FD97